uniref:Septin-type G domain-containing protein n=1 Tax=Pipistrellus kuhlii TaxID=59472 RepID=A0A7J7V667_PIPKU|nr:hypothetical protein mPipKuh1_008577 [Pipistrellus kuhlii]
MKLMVIDTPGFGDHINNENCWQPIMKFISNHFKKYLQEEVNINQKKRIPDTLVHCCLYFIPTTSHSLRPLDIEVHEAPEQSSQHSSCHRQGQHADPGGEGLLQTAYHHRPAVQCDHKYQVNRKRILSRKTKWGTIEVENIMHCEFAYPRDLLIRTHMQNIKDTTSSIHFEAYCVKHLHKSSMTNWARNGGHRIYTRRT